MQLFFSDNISSIEGRLTEDESRHCLSVLRKKTGDTIQVIDGKGFIYDCLISQDKKICAFIVQQVHEIKPLRTSRIHLAIAPTKNADRIEWLLEKAIEAGLDEISFVHCVHSEKPRVNSERLKKIAVSAIKQSGQPYLPVINELRSFKEFIAAQQSASQKLIAHCNSEYLRTPLNNVLSGYSKDTSVTILIGPEGDFSDKEIMLANESKFQGISLGNSRLRTETAGLYSVMLANGILLP
ncbi:MAG: 16S rRNA (uracil(1498)-N(3))-methyltransferase [Bacteroidia bacterium]|nr:16S rRNA (uracil(1498)-N(3))-methyltransferase [Bacteroidia bacterium]